MDSTLNILDWPALQRRLAAWRLRKARIVFTNGCFDLLHPGHIDYLEKARALGDRLVVGLNSDASVSRLKGPGRPINDEHSRARLLAALQAVDAVALFPQDTPYELIQLVQPEVLVKGGDYQIDEIVGADLVQAKGGRVTTLPFLEGYSSSQLIEKIRQGR
jgi:rfaE bifunctional protein nucleotidyltransferase chain/domain